MEKLTELSVEIPKPEEIRTRISAFEHDALLSIPKEKLTSLTDYLTGRLKAGQDARQVRLTRYMRIDRQISTWQEHTPSDSKRLDHEDQTGRQTAVEDNLPILAAHLEDMVAFYADTLSPIGNPLITTEIQKEVKTIVERVTQDIMARDYYSEVASACRSLLKYNLGGMAVEWDKSSQTLPSISGLQAAGNMNKAVDPYNVFWDPAIVNPEKVSSQAEWAAVVEPVNRVHLIRRGISGEWLNIDTVLKSTQQRYGLWFDTEKVIPTLDGANARSSGNQAADVNWSALGLGVAADNADPMDNKRYHLTTMYAWICPETYGLLADQDRGELLEAGMPATAYVELWRFEIIDGATIVSARPHTDRMRALKGESTVIPIFLTHLIRDQLRAAQRSSMELVVPFQRFASSMFALGTRALRRNVFGRYGVDGNMFNLSDLQTDSDSGFILSKIPGRDVRTGVVPLMSQNQASEAFSHVGNAMELKNTLFPSQALPAQISGLDRAVTSQVSSVVHGAQRSLRMFLRMLDSSVFMPSRMECVRNLQKHEDLVTESVSDESIAKMLGSGIESMEAERITEALWRLMMAIVQNRDAMAAFNVPAIMSYLSEVLRIKVDMATFAKAQPQQAPAGVAPGVAPGVSGMTPEEEAAVMAAQAGAVTA